MIFIKLLISFELKEFNLKETRQGKFQGDSFRASGKIGAYTTKRRVPTSFQSSLPHKEKTERLHKKNVGESLSMCQDVFFWKLANK